MAKKRSSASNRAWNILRLALLWARKGSVFKRRLMMELNLIPKYLKTLRNTTANQNSRYYGERELSFDDTPIIHVKMHRPTSLRFKMPHIPCLNPEVDFEYDFENDGDDDLDCSGDEGRKSYLKYGEDQEDHECAVCEEIEEGIDAKAEEFIAKFYEQMKLQRQISYLQYNEMLSRGAN